MDNIEITVFDEITDYKEKIYFFNFRQWLFTILIGAIVIPTYLVLKDKIGDEITSYIVILIAGILGFIGFVKIHELPAEKILPYWFRHYFLFAKPIIYMTDEEFEISKQQKKNKKSKIYSKSSVHSKNKPKISKDISLYKSDDFKDEIVKEKQNNAKEFEKIIPQIRDTKEEIKVLETTKDNDFKETNTNDETELAKQLSKLTKEQKDALLKLLGN